VIVIKLNSRQEEQTRYPAHLANRVPQGVVLEAIWERPRRELGYTVFETGDCFTEYFYQDRWFNIFAIASPAGQRKGWYCNIAAPAQIAEEEIAQVDLLLDCWIDPTGQALILDEDEFAADATLSEELRTGARQGLRDLLALLAAREGPFAELP
jgi:protein associated with RNAse G/E